MMDGPRSVPTSRLFELAEPLGKAKIAAMTPLLYSYVLDESIGEVELAATVIYSDLQSIVTMIETFPREARSEWRVFVQELLDQALGT